MNFKTQAMVHSKNDYAEVEITKHETNNNCEAVYEGKICTAIYNPLVGCYYVDDIFGVIGKMQSK